MSPEPSFLEFLSEHGLGHLVDNFGTMLMPQLVDIPQMNHDIGRMHWIVRHFVDGPYGFLTSDFPICMLPGLAYTDCIISLPISPTAVFLAAYDRSMLDAVVALPPHQVIDQVNEISVQSARSYVFADSAQYRELVEKMLRTPA